MGLLHAVTVFWSAFLLFALQPALAKAVLPWFGGTSAVWITCLLFFQTVLFGGYLYAHALIRLASPRQQAAIHIALLAAAAAMLPVIPSSNWKPTPGSDPVSGILVLLAASCGLQYFLLSATGPLVQAWFARTTGHPMPYRLYALSNLGSMGALLLYPPVIERALGTSVQLRAWSIGFGLFAALCAVLAFRSRSAATMAAAATSPSAPTPPIDIAWWFCLSATASALLMAITNHLCQNVAAMPFLWTLPLAAYLLTLVVCFDRPSWYRRTAGLIAQAAGLGLAVWGLLGITLDAGLHVQIPVFIASLLLICYFCHGELVARRPEASALTLFYLTVSAGGAAGGLLIGVAAPRLLNGPFELPLTLCAAGALTLLLVYGKHWANDAIWAAAMIGLILAARVWIQSFTAGARSLDRSFYGNLSIRETGGFRLQSSGIINHGQQFLDPAKRMWPTTYYGPDSGAALALRFLDRAPLRTGIVGLGIGVLATYGRPGDTIRFYEINPAVIRLAREDFTFLSGSAARIEIVEGDARLVLEREPPQGFDLLVVDAFLGDSIPVHLLTREAAAVYFRHLKPDGVLAMHLSNLYLDLVPVVHRVAASLGREARVIVTAPDAAKGLAQSIWVVVTNNREFLDRAQIAPMQPPRTVALWTDDHSNLWEVLR